MSRAIRRWALLALGVLLLAACGSDSNADSRQPAATRTLVPPTPTPTALPFTPTVTPTDLPAPSALEPAATESAEGPLPADAQAILAGALADLSARQDINPADIRLISLEAITWPDTSLGCASARDGHPGNVHGYRLLFSAGRDLYTYHADRGETVLLCEDADWTDWQGEPLPPDPIAESMVELAARDAARQLDVPTSQLALASLMAVTWPDASIGCPKPNGEYEEQTEPGFRIAFRAGEEAIIYTPASATWSAARRTRKSCPACCARWWPHPNPLPERKRAGRNQPAIVAFRNAPLATSGPAAARPIVIADRPGPHTRRCARPDRGRAGRHTAA